MEIKDLYGNKNLEGAYLFYGSEDYLMEDALRNIQANYLSPDLEDFNQVFFRGDKLDVLSLEESLEVLPLMASHRLVLVRGVQEFIDRQKPEDDFYKGLFNLPKSTLLFLMEDQVGVKKNQKLYRRFSKAGRAISFEPLKDPQFQNFIRKYLYRRGRKIHPANLAYFASRTGYMSRNIDIDLHRVAGDLDKLISLSGDEITREMIDMAMEPPADENIFNLLTALVEKDPRKVFRMKDELLAMGEPVARILYMVIRQVRLLLGFKVLQEKNYSLANIQKSLGIKSPYEAKKIHGQSHRFTKEQLLSFYPILIEADQSLKTSSLDENLVLEGVLAKMTQK
ncbi:MAG: DNA polymerase III subunit delta [Tissierellia bacterium]|nr:DNA polymerase III subunit delta [Tissierellia bacterium]